MKTDETDFIPEEYSVTDLTAAYFPNDRFELNAGEPFVHCLPISDKNIKIKMHVVSDEEFAKTDVYHFTFSGNYYKSKKFKEENKK